MSFSFKYTHSLLGMIGELFANVPYVAKMVPIYNTQSYASTHTHTHNTQLTYMKICRQCWYCCCQQTCVEWMCVENLTKSIFRLTDNVYRFEQCSFISMHSPSRKFCFPMLLFAYLALFELLITNFWLNKVLLLALKH